MAQKRCPNCANYASYDSSSEYWICSECNGFFAECECGGLMELYNNCGSWDWHWLCNNCGSAYLADVEDEEVDLDDY